MGKHCSTRGGLVASQSARVRSSLGDAKSLMSELMKMLNPAWSKALKRLRYPFEAILTCVRWYVAYPRSLLHLLEEMTAERSVPVDKAGDTVDCLLRCGAPRRSAFTL